MKCELHIHAKNKYQCSDDDSLGKRLWKGMRNFQVIPRKGDDIDVRKQVGKYDIDAIEFVVVKVSHKQDKIAIYLLEQNPWVCSHFDKSQPERFIDISM